MKKKAIKTTKEVEELTAQLKRAVADYQNLERRAKEERADWIRTANKELLLRLLPVLDTLILANKHLNDAGLAASIKQFIDVLEGEGVKKIETEGQEFDPHTMECVTTAVGEANKIMEEVRSGFMLNGQTIRPAQVKVGKKTMEEQYV